MIQAHCKLCGEYKELCDSHAVPNSAFRYILRNSSGKAIVAVDDAATPIHYSADSWDAPLLCQICEDKLNLEYDSYGIAVFRGHAGKTSQTNAGVSFSGIDRQRLRMFFLSVLWRVSISPHQAYRNIDLPYILEDELHLALKHSTVVNNSKFHVGVYRLKDSTNPGGFSQKDLRSLVAAPFARKFRDKKFISVCFVFFGFLVEIFIPRLPRKIANQPGVLVGNSPIFLAPYQEITEVPELMNLMVNALRKHLEGLSAIG